MRAQAGLLTFTLLALTILTSCWDQPAPAKTDRLLRAYDVEQDWNDPQRLIPLGYLQAQGKRVFYHNCVWCHADATPAGPSNRFNLTPAPPLANDGATFNTLSDEFMLNMISLGGGAMGKSAMMPPWDQTLAQDEIKAVITFVRAIAQPPYHASARRGPLWEPLCYAQIGGLTLATFITLLLVPVIYSIFVLDLKVVSWGIAVSVKREEERNQVEMEPAGQLG